MNVCKKLFIVLAILSSQVSLADIDVKEEAILTPDSIKEFRKLMGSQTSSGVEKGLISSDFLYITYYPSCKTKECKDKYGQRDLSAEKRSQKVACGHNADQYKYVSN